MTSEANSPNERQTNAPEPDAKKKRPIHMRPAAAPFALAGVYDVWRAHLSLALVSGISCGAGSHPNWHGHTTTKSPEITKTFTSLAPSVPSDFVGWMSI